MTKIIVLLLLIFPNMLGAQQLPTPDVSAPLLRGLVSWWRGLPGFTGGNAWYDIGPAHNPGTLTNMAYTATSGWSLTDRPGYPAQVNFDGTDDYVVIGDFPAYDFPDTTFSVEVVFRATTQAGYLLAKRTSSGVGGGWFLRLNSDGTMTARVVTPSGTVAGANTTVLTTLLSGAWYHAVIVFVTNTATSTLNYVVIYINGVQDPGTDATHSDIYSPCACPLTFGSTSDQGSGTFLRGALAQIRIWNRGLADSEIATLYAQMVSGETQLARLPETLLTPGVGVAAGPKPRKYFSSFR